MKFRFSLYIACGLVLLPLTCGFAQEAATHDLALDINVISIVLNDEHRTGVDWEAIVSDYHALALKNQDDASVIDKKNKLSIGTVSDEDYAVLLDALDTVGTMTQQKQPLVTLKAEDNQRININLVDNKTVNNIRLDLLLKNDPSNPMLNIEPYIGHQKAQTKIAIADHTTIVLGGIISEQEITKTHKFPLLGSLPIVGFVFRSQGKLMQRVETIIFLSPRMKAITDTSKEEASS